MRVFNLSSGYPGFTAAGPQTVAGSGENRLLAGLIKAFAVALFVLWALAPAFAKAQSRDTAAYQSVRSFLDQRDKAQSVLFFVHFGANYRGHEFLRVTGVEDRNGNSVPGESAVVYRYHWQDDGVTDVAFFYDDRGNIVGSSIDHTNAVFSQPFAIANASIWAVGHFVINSDNNMSDADRKAASELVDRSDAHGLMNLWLRLR